MTTTALLTFHTMADDAEPDTDEGYREVWEATVTEQAEVLTASDERTRFRSTSRSTGESFEWEAYRYDFGGDLGKQWAYGSSAELLGVNV